MGQPPHFFFFSLRKTCGIFRFSGEGLPVRSRKTETNKDHGEVGYTAIPRILQKKGGGCVGENAVAVFFYAVYRLKSCIPR